MANTCNFPECEKDVVSHGLCWKHWNRASKCKDPALRAEALKYATEPRRKIGARPEHFNQVAGKTAEDRQGGEGDGEKRSKDLNKRLDRAAVANQKTAGAVIAAVTEFAIAVGLKPIPHDGGFLFSSTAWGERMIYLTPGGRIRNASVRISEVP